MAEDNIDVAIAMMNFEKNMKKDTRAEHMHDGECNHENCGDAL